MSPVITNPSKVSTEHREKEGMNQTNEGMTQYYLDKRKTHIST